MHQPHLKEWHDNPQSFVKNNEYEIQIVEIEKGFDKAKKHVDTKLVMISSEQRYVLHVYNTTQNLMVQGRNSEASSTLLQ